MDSTVVGIISFLILAVIELCSMDLSNPAIRSLVKFTIYGFSILALLVLKMFYNVQKFNDSKKQTSITDYPGFRVTRR